MDRPAVVGAARGGGVPVAGHPARLLPPAGRPGGGRPGGDLSAYLDRFGPLPYRGAPGLLIPEIAAAGLTGRGGASFPVHRKLSAVAGHRPGRVIVAGNGAEGEPAGDKDKTLLREAPYLVLDGLQLAAEAVQASSTVLYVCCGSLAVRCIRRRRGTRRASRGQVRPGRDGAGRALPGAGVRRAVRSVPERPAAHRGGAGAGREIAAPRRVLA